MEIGKYYVITKQSPVETATGYSTLKAARNAVVKDGSYFVVKCLDTFTQTTPTPVPQPVRSFAGGVKRPRKEKAAKAKPKGNGEKSATKPDDKAKDNAK